MRVMAIMHRAQNHVCEGVICGCRRYDRCSTSLRICSTWWKFQLCLVQGICGFLAAGVRGLMGAIKNIQVVGVIFLLVWLLSAVSFTRDQRLSEDIEVLADHFQYWISYIWKSKPAKSTIIVAKNGTADFIHIQQAVDSVPDWHKRRTVILICSGIYREKVFIPKEKEKITLLGEGNGTVIEWNNTASDHGPNGLPLKTYHSATVEVDAEFFVAKNIIFKNAARPPELGQQGRQAVALRVSADKAAFYNCTFLGHQDTLYDHKGRHYFKNCSVKGSIDFIFGNGRSLYQECNIIASTEGHIGILTAQRRNIKTMDTGFSFVGCIISGSGKNYLGRAWGRNSRVVFSHTWMDDIIVPKGWDDWGSPDGREKSVFYAQYKCFGPGANTSLRVSWSRELSPEEALPFLTVNFIEGREWLEEI
ncbi:hypothetical protein O6H91_08G070700 [Diphasiastrum complanatum]|uniref:Uncharacterized protein n=1 Tax=Diphasiastrum complanatum TaxID=34168 RepID=A0ACC2CZ02_DIPCM|nr:hypothetical protein O6H91_08G070700 [Diphasiastrum complanatum]